MTQTIQRAKKVGGSLMIRIPKDIADIEGIGPGEIVEVEIRKARKSWFGAFPGLTPFDKDKDRMKSKYE